MPERPSYRELGRKLEQGIEAVKKDAIALLNPDIINSDLLDLDYAGENLAKDLSVLFLEIRPQDYKGLKPPQRSYEEEIFESELFAFAWNSRLFGCDMYFKFALKEGVLWIVSLHRDRK